MLVFKTTEDLNEWVRAPADNKEIVWTLEEPGGISGHVRDERWLTRLQCDCGPRPSPGGCCASWAGPKRQDLDRQLPRGAAVWQCSLDLYPIFCDTAHGFHLVRSPKENTSLQSVDLVAPAEQFSSSSSAF